MTKENNKNKFKDKDQDKKKIKSTYESVKEGDILVETDLEDEDEEVGHDPELDPEILEALNVKKKAKPKPTSNVDYIPELERWDEPSDTDDDF